jgi:hypothetical protein
MNWEIYSKETKQKLELLNEYQKETEITEKYLLSEVEHKFSYNSFCTISVVSTKNLSGKTYVLNKISDSKLKEGEMFKENKQDISFKIPKKNEDKNYLLIDTKFLNEPISMLELKKNLKMVKKI